jgi:DNA-binding IclR family transcriptional regulator
VRGRVLKALVKASPLTLARIVKETGMDRERVKDNLLLLVKEGFIQQSGKKYLIG